MTESIKQKVKQPSVFLMVKYDRIDVCIDRYEMFKTKNLLYGWFGIYEKTDIWIDNRGIAYA